MSWPHGPNRTCRMDGVAAAGLRHGEFCVKCVLHRRRTAASRLPLPNMRPEPGAQRKARGCGQANAKAVVEVKQPQKIMPAGCRKRSAQFVLGLDISARRHATSADRDLMLTRLIDAPREKLYRAWTDPTLLKQWFAPLPYTTPVAELDVRPGGSAFIVMRGPDGNGPAQPRRLSRGRAEPAAGLHRRLRQGVGAVGEAVHDADPHLRG